MLYRYAANRLVSHSYNNIRTSVVIITCTRARVRKKPLQKFDLRCWFCCGQTLSLYLCVLYRYYYYVCRQGAVIVFSRCTMRVCFNPWLARTRINENVLLRCDYIPYH